MAEVIEGWFPFQGGLTKPLYQKKTWNGIQMFIAVQIPLLIDKHHIVKAVVRKKLINA